MFGNVLFIPYICTYKRYIFNKLKEIKMEKTQLEINDILTRTVFGSEIELIIVRTTKTLAFARPLGQTEGNVNLIKFRRKISDGIRVHLVSALKFDVIPYILKKF